MNTPIEVLQIPSELEKMIRLYRRKRPQRVLEIGSWEGGTLRVWLRHAPAGGTVVAVDLDHRNRHLYERWRKPDTSLHVVTGDSQSLTVAQQIREHGPYDWVFIDGDHSDRGVRIDVMVCLPLIRPGGVMLLHDIDGGTVHPAEHPPSRLLRELEQIGARTDRWVDPEPMPWAHGVGVAHL